MGNGGCFELVNVKTSCFVQDDGNELERTLCVLLEDGVSKDWARNEYG